MHPALNIWKYAFISLYKLQPVAFAPVLKTLLTTWRLQLPMLIKPRSSLKNSENFQFTLGQSIIIYLFQIFHVKHRSSILIID